VSTPVETKVSILRRNRGLLGVPVATLVVGAILGSPWGPTNAGPLAALLDLWGGLFTLIILLSNPTPRRIERVVRADADGLWSEGDILLPKTRIVHAYVQPTGRPEPDSALVEVRARGGPCMTLVTDLRSADAIVTALGFGVGGRRASIWGRSPVALWGIGPLSILVLLVPVVLAAYAVGPLVGKAAFLGYLALFAASWVPARIDVGADGVLRSWLGMRRFVAFRDVASVEGRRGRVDVTLLKQDGTRVGMSARRRYAERGAFYPALLSRIQEAFEAHRANASYGDLDVFLARRGRGVREWVAQIRALTAAQGTGYRSSALSQERLLRVVEDPSAAPTLRAGAAVALAQEGHGAWREELGRAAEACGHPRVRVLLQAVSGDDGAEGAPGWVDALEELGDDEDDDTYGATRPGRTGSA
jgi:hypothetical protein